MAKDGITPEIHCIEEVSEVLASDLECQWIARGVAEGWNLTNTGTGRMPIPWDSSAYLTKEYLDRFWSNIIDNGPDACWGWRAYKTDKGYGQFTVGAKRDKNIRRIYVHRLMWEIVNGPIPNRLLVCHKCDNPECSNPDHLFLDTAGGNMKDAASKGRLRGKADVTHCKRGHPFDEENTYLNPEGKRVCRTCAREDSRIRQRDVRQQKRTEQGRKIKKSAQCDECGFISTSQGVSHHLTSFQHSGKTMIEPIKES